MIEFIEAPMHQNWLQKNKPKKSLIISSPFVKIKTLERLLKYYDFFLGKEQCNLKVLMRAQEDDFIKKSSDIEVIEYLVNLKKQYPEKVEVRLINNLHMKAYCIDNRKLLITSGNLTPRGLTNTGKIGNVEAGLACDEEDVVKKFEEYFLKVFSVGMEITKFVTSTSYMQLKNRINNNQPPSSSSNKSRNEINCFDIPKAKEDREYPINEKEDSDYIKYELINPLKEIDVPQNIKDYIPQNANKNNYYKVLKYIYKYELEEKSIDKLAKYLGSKAIKESSRSRMVSGILTNLRLLGLIENCDCKNGFVIQKLTEVGKEFIDGDASVQKKILQNQSAKLPWMNHIKAFREVNTNADINKILREYLCSNYIGYACTSSKRYSPAMKYFCKLNGIL